MLVRVQAKPLRGASGGLDPPCAPRHAGKRRDGRHARENTRRMASSGRREFLQRGCGTVAGPESRHLARCGNRAVPLVYGTIKGQSPSEQAQGKLTSPLASQFR